MFISIVLYLPLVLNSGHCSGHVNVYSLTSDSWKSLPSTSINMPSHLASTANIAMGGVHMLLFEECTIGSYVMTVMILMH